MNQEPNFAFERFIEDLKKRHPDWFSSAPIQKMEIDRKLASSGEEVELWDEYEE